MKILLDENIPIALKKDFSSDHTVLTVRDMNWLGKKNGELLRLMIVEGFEAFVSIDKNLSKQQNLSTLGIKIFVLLALNNKISTLKPFIARVQKLLNSKIISNLVEVKVE